MIALLATTGLLAAPASAAKSASPVTLNLNLNSYISPNFTSMDIQAFDNNANVWVASTYDRLIAIDRKGQAVPYIGTPVKSTPKSITFKIRSGVKCPDGQTIKAANVYDSFMRLLNVPKTSSNKLSTYFGSGPFHLSYSRLKNTFTFATETAYQPLVYGFAAPAAVVICPQGFQALSADPTAMVKASYGSGPYQIVSAQDGVGVVLAKRPGWNWGPADMTPDMVADKINLTPVTTPAAASNLAVTGALDAVLMTSTGTPLDQMIAAKDFYRQNIPQYGVGISLEFNISATHPTSNQVLRQALSMVISRHDFGQAMNNGFGTIATSLLSPAQVCYTSMKSLAVEGTIAQAQQLLSGAGYTFSNNGTVDPKGNPLKITVITIPSAEGLVGPYLQNLYGRLLGTNSVNLVDNLAGYQAAFVVGNYDVIGLNTLQTVEADGQRLGLFYGTPSSQGGSNYSQVNDLTLTQLFNSALAQPAFTPKGVAACKKRWDTAIRYGLSHFYFYPGWTPVQLVYFKKDKFIRPLWAGFRPDDLLYYRVKRS